MKKSFSGIMEYYVMSIEVPTGFFDRKLLKRMFLKWREYEYD